MKKNREQMSLIDGNMKQIHENTVNYLAQNMNASFLAPLFHRTSPAPSKKIQIIREIQQNTLWDPSFFSVIFYNGLTKDYFSTRDYAEKDEFITDRMSHPDQVDSLVPIMRELPYDAYYTKRSVFTYFYFEEDRAGHVHKAAIVNIDTKFLLDNLLKLKGDNSSAYIYDRSSQSFIDQTGAIRSESELDPLLLEKIKEEKLSDSFSNQEDHKMYSYLHSSYANWVLIIEESDEILLQNNRTNLQIILQIILMVFLAALLFIAITAYQINQPIRDLMRKLIPFSDKEEKFFRIHDKIAHISDVFHQTRSDMERFKEYKSSTDEILREPYARTFLKGSSAEQVEFIKLSSDELKKQFEKPQQMIVLSLYDYEKNLTLQSNTQRAFKYAIMNLAEELLDQGHGVVTVEMEKEYIVVLITLNSSIFSSVQQDSSYFLVKTRQVQAEIKAIIGFTISAYIAPVVEDIHELEEGYLQTQQQMQRRVMFSQGVVLQEAPLSSDDEGEFDAEEAELEILAFMNQNQFDETREELAKHLEAWAVEENVELFRNRVTRVFLALFEKNDRSGEK